MGNLAKARRECMAQLRKLAEECERQSWQQNFAALQAKKDAYLYAAEIVQSCFPVLDLERVDRIEQAAKALLDGIETATSLGIIPRHNGSDLAGRVRDLDDALA